MSLATEVIIQKGECICVHDLYLQIIFLKALTIIVQTVISALRKAI